MTPASALYSERHAVAAGIHPSDIGANSWSDVAAIRAWQKARGLQADAYFGPESVKAFRAEHPKPKPPLPSSHKAAFVSQITAAAARECPKHGIPPQVCVAQAILESGWGKSAGGYNCFGIKGAGDAGTQVWKTREFLGGKWITINDNFAKYSSFDAAVAAYCHLLTKPRYMGAIQHFPRDPARFITYVWASGYATAPDYPAYVCGVMRAAGQLSGDPTYNVTPDHGLNETIAKLRAAAFGSARIKVRDAEMLTRFRSPVGVPSTGVDVPPEHDCPECADAATCCDDGEPEHLT